MQCMPVDGRFRLLIIDDDKDTNEYYATYFQNQNYDVKVVLDGEQALQADTEFDTQLALIDLALTNEDGIDVMDRLLEQNPQLRCLILTAYASIETALSALRHGAVDYLSKDVSLDE